MGKYGPFADVVAIAGALVAVFSALLLKMMGRTKNWTWMAVDSPPFVVTLGARILAVALMGVTYITINIHNYGWFAAGALICAIIGFYFLYLFNHLRRLYVHPIPELAKNGSQLMKKGKPVFRNVVIGAETDMIPEAKADLQKTRIARSGLSLVEFMSGYGTPPNNPENLWDREVLARHGNRLTLYLMFIVLSSVMVLYWAAFIISVFKDNT